MEGDRRLIFVYGTLKRGFPNHRLIKDLVSNGDASFFSSCHTALRFPLVLGPLSIPFLLPLPPVAGRRVSGELFSVSSRGLDLLDELEGTLRGHYERLPIAVVPGGDGNGEEDAREEEVVKAEAYFAHRSYAEEMWRRCGEIGLGLYSEEDAALYVLPKDRPRDITFLGELRKFLASKD